MLAFFADTPTVLRDPDGPRSCIGTTDTRVERRSRETTEDDIEFLLEQINARLELDSP